MMSERNQRDSFISFNRKHTRISCELNLVVPKITDCKMHMKVIASQTAGVESESKLYMSAVTRNIAAKLEVSLTLLLPYQRITLIRNHKTLILLQC